MHSGRTSKASLKEVERGTKTSVTAAIMQVSSNARLPIGLFNMVARPAMRDLMLRRARGGPLGALALAVEFGP